jgi:hypothetical protein
MAAITDTAQPVSIQSRAKEIFREACRALGIGHERIAAAIHRHRTKVDRWANPDHDESVPVWPLLVPEAIPDAVFERIIADVRAERRERGTNVRAEGVAAVLLARLGSAVTEIANAMADGRITSIEAAGVVKRISDVEEECRKLRRALSHVVAGAVS